MKNNLWKAVSKKILVKTPFLTLQEDLVLRPDGKVEPYYLVKRGSFSIAIPFENDRLFMVRQYRYATGSWSLEFPAGYVKGKNPLNMAKTELLEEAGIEAKKFLLIGRFYVASGHMNQLAYVFLAQELKFGTPKPEPGEFLKQEDYSFSEVTEMIANGKILDGPTIVAFHFLENYLNSKEKK